MVGLVGGFVVVGLVVYVGVLAGIGIGAAEASLLFVLDRPLYFSPPFISTTIIPPALFHTLLYSYPISPSSSAPRLAHPFQSQPQFRFSVSFFPASAPSP